MAPLMRLLLHVRRASRTHRINPYCALVFKSTQPASRAALSTQAGIWSPRHSQHLEEAQVCVGQLRPEHAPEPRFRVVGCAHRQHGLRGAESAPRGQPSGVAPVCLNGTGTHSQGEPTLCASRAGALVRCSTWAVRNVRADVCACACMCASANDVRAGVRSAEEAPRALVARTCALLPGSGWSRGTSYVYSRIGCTEPFTVTRSSRRHSRCTCRGHPRLPCVRAGANRATAGAGLFVCVQMAARMHCRSVRRGPVAPSAIAL